MLVAAFAAAAAAPRHGSAWIGLAAGIGGVGAFWRWCTASPPSPSAATRSSPGVAINMLAGGPDRDRRQCLVRAGRPHAAAGGRMRFGPVTLPGSPGSARCRCWTALYRGRLRPYHPRVCRPRGGHRDLVRAGARPASACACAPSAKTRRRSTPPASRSRALRYAAVILAGVLCGLGGAYLSLAQAAGFLPNMTAGKGFIALAALIFAKWRAWPALGAASCSACSMRWRSGCRASRLPGIGLVPVQAIQALPYALTVILLAGFIGTRHPAAGVRHPLREGALDGSIDGPADLLEAAAAIREQRLCALFAATVSARRSRSASGRVYAGVQRGERRLSGRHLRGGGRDLRDGGGRRPRARRRSPSIGGGRRAGDAVRRHAGSASSNSAGAEAPRCGLRTCADSARRFTADELLPFAFGPPRMERE